jgi:hypothetical protein
LIFIRAAEIASVIRTSKNSREKVATGRNIWGMELKIVKLKGSLTQMKQTIVMVKFPQ